jgi:hypothetical protein
VKSAFITLLSITTTGFVVIGAWALASAFVTDRPWDYRLALVATYALNAAFAAVTADITDMAAKSL